MERNKISILIPVYNVKEYLVDCFESIKNQEGYSNYEVIIVDDGSTDGGGMVCDAYQASDSRFKVFHNENHGLIYSRRFALKQASGDIIIFLDSDDYLELNALKKIMDTFEQYDCDCVIYGLQQILQGKVIYTNTEKETVVLEDKKELFRKYFITDCYNSIWRKAVKRSVFDGRDYSNFFHLKMSEDILQSVEIIENSKKVVFLEDILYNYRVNPGSITQSINYEKYTIDYSIRDYVRNRITENNVFDEKDFFEYKKMCIESICAEIAGIAGSEVSRDRKKELFISINSSLYYRELLTGSSLNALSKKNKIIWFMFRRKAYGGLIDLIRLYKRIKR